MAHSCSSRVLYVLMSLSPSCGDKSQDENRIKVKGVCSQVKQGKQNVLVCLCLCKQNTS